MRAPLYLTIDVLTRRLGDFRDDQVAEAGLVFEKLRKAQKELCEIIRQLPQQSPGGMGSPGMKADSPAPSPGVMVGTTMPPGTPLPAAGTAPGAMSGGMAIMGGAGSASGGGGTITPGAMAGGMRIVAGTPPLDPPERERRMKHVKAAAESLRQAGLPEHADGLVREAEAIFSGRAPAGTWVPAGYPARSGMPPGYPGSSGPSGGPGGYPGSSGPSGMPSGYAGTGGPTGYPGTGGPPAGYPVPGYSPTGMSPYGPPLDPATTEIRNQLREMQKQIEELRKQLQELKGASPTGRSSENRR